MSEPKYNGRTRAEIVAIIGENAADNYISWREPDPERLSLDERNLLSCMYERIAHGDDAHRAWLRDELRRLIVDLGLVATREG